MFPKYTYNGIFPGYRFQPLLIYFFIRIILFHLPDLAFFLRKHSTARNTFRIHLLILKNSFDRFHRFMLTKDCPAAQEFLGCHIRSCPDDFLFLTQGQYFFIFQKDAAFAGHLICFCPVIQGQFSTLSKTCKGIFKKSQLIFHHQNPECAFVDKGFRNLSVLHQFFQSEHISRTHHIYIHSGFYSLNRRFIHIGCHTLFFQLSDGTPV